MKSGKEKECGACGNPDVLPGWYYNPTRDLKIKLCRMCAIHATINGFKEMEKDETN
jgi:hypothetical protein